MLTVPTNHDLSSVSFHIPATEQIVPVFSIDLAHPNLNWYPVVAIRVAPCDLPKPAANNSPVTVNDELTRVSFWLTRAIDVDGAGTPSDIQYQVRAASNCTSEVIGTGTIKLTFGFDQIGLIAQASGILCNQWELWARVPAGGTRMGLGIDVMADRLAGAQREFYKGSVSV